MSLIIPAFWLRKWIASFVCRLSVSWKIEWKCLTDYRVMISLSSANASCQCVCALRHRNGTVVNRRRASFHIQFDKLPSSRDQKLRNIQIETNGRQHVRHLIDSLWCWHITHARAREIVRTTKKVERELFEGRGNPEITLIFIWRENHIRTYAHFSTNRWMCLVRFEYEIVQRINWHH